MSCNKLLNLLALFIIVPLLASCASAKPVSEKVVRVKEMQSSSSAMLYGQIVVPSEYWALRHVMIQRVGKVYGGMGLRGLGERVHFSPDGKFVVPNIKPGNYMLAGFVIGSEQNFLGKEALNYQITVKAGGIHYFGAYKYVEGEQKRFRPSTFSLEQDKGRARHAQVLSWVAKSTVNTKWQPGVQAKLKRYQRYLPKTAGTTTR